MRPMAIEFWERCCSGDPSIKNIGVQVGSVWPRNGSEFRIDANPSEVSRISHRLEDSAKAELMCEVNHALNTVLELKVQAIIARRPCGNNIFQHVLLLLLKWCNRPELCLGPRQVPVLHQFVAMQCGPLYDQPQRARR